MGEEKLPKVTLDPERFITTSFLVGEKAVDAVLLPAKGKTSPADYVVGVEEQQDDEGMRTKRYLKIPRRLHEAKDTTVEYYHDHETLVKGVGAFAVVTGAVVVGSLFVKRFKDSKN